MEKEILNDKESICKYKLYSEECKECLFKTLCEQNILYINDNKNGL